MALLKIGIAIATGDLPVDLTLLAVSAPAGGPQRSFAAVQLGSGPLDGCAGLLDPREGVISSGTAEFQEPIASHVDLFVEGVEPAFSHVCLPIPAVGELLSDVSFLFALIGQTLTLVGVIVAIARDAVTA
jgi:hypothetical protein